MVKKLYLRACFASDGRELMAICVCTTKHQLLEDSQIVEWFEPDTSGAYIREWFSDHDDGPFVLTWAPPIRTHVSAGEA
jgi:hypothetical protein